MHPEWLIAIAAMTTHSNSSSQSTHSQSYRVAILRGDGIGPEVVDATVRVLEATGIAFEWVPLPAGEKAIETHGSSVPEVTLQGLSTCHVALKGPTTTPVGTGHASANVALRKKLDLYANVRPVQSMKGIESRYDNVDLVIVRENTEGLYVGMEHMILPGVAQSLKIITEKASTRIARYAFEYARKHGRKRITAGHKANIMKLSDGLFIQCCKKVAAEYPEITYDEVIVDNLCMQLVRDPTRFDMLVLENLYGDILSDLCAGLVGGLGVVPGANIGEKGAVFEAVHGSAPDIAGKGIANPTACILSGVMMLEHIGEPAAAARVRQAIQNLYANTRIRTGDLGGSANTAAFTNAIIEQMTHS